MIFDYATLKVIWWCLVGAIIIVFALTDGWDLGIGILSPFLGHTDDERRIILRSIEPNWEGNQTWLVIAGGVIFAAWPLVYAHVVFRHVRRDAPRPVRLVLSVPSASSTGTSSDARLAHCLGLGPLHRRLRPRAGVRRRVRQSAAGRAVPFRRRYACVLRRKFLATAQSLRVAGRSYQRCAARHARCRVLARAPRRRHPGTRRARGENPWLLVVAFAAAGVWVAYGIEGYRITSTDVDANAIQLAKTVVKARGAWLDNCGRHPWMMAAPCAGVLGRFGRRVVSAGHGARCCRCWQAPGNVIRG